MHARIVSVTPAKGLFSDNGNVLKVDASRLSHVVPGALTCTRILRTLYLDEYVQVEIIDYFPPVSAANVPRITRDASRGSSMADQVRLPGDFNATSELRYYLRQRRVFPRPNVYIYKSFVTP